MNTEIKYTNTFNKPITNQQLNLSEPHHKHFYVDGKLKKIEMYDYFRSDVELVLYGVEYFLSGNENLNDIINEYVSENLYHFVVWYNNQTNSFGDQYWEYNIYTWLAITVKGKKVFNNESLLIASCSININTGLIDDRRKYFYGDISIYERLEYEEEFLSVNYDDSDLEEIYVGDDDFILEEFIDSQYADVFVWNDHPYYHSFEPMLPTGPL